jgi:hypothetical protein
MQETRDDRSLGELLGDLAQQTATLARQEVELAKTEMTEKASRVGRNLGFLAIGGAVAYAGFLAILAALIVALAANGVPWWLAALLVGVVVAGVGYVLVQKGLAALKREELAPRQTIETLKEDKDWAKEQIT